ncbi:hypothetical protein HDE_00861 [Halotydeus destructor]|nr:hypothetical protein HDE_00861 [Halotydeus destructor]
MRSLEEDFVAVSELFQRSEYFKAFRGLINVILKADLEDDGSMRIAYKSIQFAYHIAKEDFLTARQTSDGFEILQHILKHITLHKEAAVCAVLMGQSHLTLDARLKSTIHAARAFACMAKGMTTVNLYTLSATIGMNCNVESLIETSFFERQIMMLGRKNEEEEKVSVNPLLSLNLIFTAIRLKISYNEWKKYGNRSSYEYQQFTLFRQFVKNRNWASANRIIELFKITRCFSLHVMVLLRLSFLSAMKKSHQLTGNYALLLHYYSTARTIEGITELRNLFNSLSEAHYIQTFGSIGSAQELLLLLEQKDHLPPDAYAYHSLFENYFFVINDSQSKWSKLHSIRSLLLTRNTKFLDVMKDTLTQKVAPRTGFVWADYLVPRCLLYFKIHRWGADANEKLSAATACVLSAYQKIPKNRRANMDFDTWVLCARLQSLDGAELY